MKTQTTLFILVTILFTTSITPLTFGQDVKSIKNLSPRESYIQGEELADSSRYSKALPFFEQAYAGFDQDSIRQRAKSIVSILICYESLRMTKEMESRLPDFQSIIDQLPPQDANRGLYYKSISNHYFDARQFPNAIKFYDLYIAYLEQQEEKNWELIFQAKRMKGDCYSFVRDFDTALEISEDYNKIAVEKLSENKLIQMINLCSRGLIAGKSGDYSKSLDYYLTAEKIIPELSDSIRQKENIATIYTGIATSYGFSGDLHKALPYFYKSYQDDKKGDVQGMIMGLSNIGICHVSIGNIDEAILAYDEAREIVKSIPGNQSYYLNIINYTYADVLIQKGEYEEALMLYENLVKSYTSETDDAILASSEVHKNIAGIYVYKLNNYEKAEFHLEKSFDLMSQLKNQERYSDVARIALYDLKSKNIILNSKDQNLDEALEYARKAIGINILNPNYQLGDPINVKDLSNYTEIIASLRTVFIVYQNKYKKDKNNTELLEKASYYSNTIDVLLDSLLAGDYYNPESIKILKKNNGLAYGGNVFTELQLSQNKDRIDKAFYFTEKSKSITLLQGVREDRIKILSGVSADILTEEKRYKDDISKVKEQISRLKDGDKSVLDSLQKEVFDLTIEQEELVEKIKNNYPNYYSMKYDYGLTNIQEIQNKVVDNNTAVVQFSFGLDYTNVFLIQKNNSDFISKINPDNIYKLIDEYVDLLKNSKTNKKRQLELSQYLYNYFISPILNKIDGEVANVVIVPTSKLNYIPFETLQDSTGKYLIQDYNISYAYSSTSLLEQIQKPNSKNKKGFGGFAAEYNQEFVGLDTLANPQLSELIRNGEYNLPGAAAEVRSISQILLGNQFTGKEATVDKFKEVANQYKVLHLAMHSNLNENAPLLSSLLFSKLDDKPNELTATDLYGLRLDADLVVLSACNTGSGKLQKGEGIMSLSRAFTYAGVPSTVMSLWKVPDASTSEIMISFYEHLKEGKPKDEALRLAKLDYLENIDSPEAAHPFYWAGFVLSGDTEPIAESFSSGISWIPYLIIGGLILLLLYLFIRKKRNP